MEKSLKTKCLARIYKKISHTTWTSSIKIKVICLYKSNHEVHEVWLVFFISLGEIFWIERFLQFFFKADVYLRYVCDCIWYLLLGERIRNGEPIQHRPLTPGPKKSQIWPKWAGRWRSNGSGMLIIDFCPFNKNYYLLFIK